MTATHKCNRSFFAHTGKTTNGMDWQVLVEHLRGVGAGAFQRARLVDSFCKSTSFGFAPQAMFAGWLHDLGKYRPEFQDYLFGRPVPRDRTYHKQAGASKLALLGYVPAAFAIAGHHGGMTSKADLQDAVMSADGRVVMEQVWEIACSENPALASITACDAQITREIDIDFASRIVLSCLVDADWEDTSNFHRSLGGLSAEPSPLAFEVDRLLTQLLSYVKSRSASCPDVTIRKVRDQVLQACLSAATGTTGVYSLTVPTGGGKTLSSLAFALRHAQQHKLRRIIYVAPYLSIIDQNAKVIREALDLMPEDRTLFAHHSLSDSYEGDQANGMDQTAAARRAENWDAPLVVTTNVQFFESLFSNKPSRCRKLHNLAGSVVLLDECQSVPSGLVAPTCAILRQLSNHVQCTIVLCTATQPAFNHPAIPCDQRLISTEIIPAPYSLFSQLTRVGLQWPQQDEYWTWSDVASRMRESKSKHPAALCIVNSRRAAREVFAELKWLHEDGIFHLSTSMCPAHRMQVLEEVRARLREGRKCLLGSTQLIEAGVDVDFPLVMREMAPLEAIIQAAGRCNREGRLTEDGKSIKGNTIVFRSTAFRDERSQYYPSDQWYKAGLTTLETNFLAAGRFPKIDRPEDISDYYTLLFHTGLLDAKKIHQSRVNLNFEKVAEDYKIIRDESVAIVVGTWKTQLGTTEKFLEAVCTDPSRANFRKLAPYQVNVRRHELVSPAGTVIAKPFEHLDLRVWYGPYDEQLGMSTDETDTLMIA
jgi:CRISPR-associated endonuclease/helicase Cas3